MKCKQFLTDMIRYRQMYIIIIEALLTYATKDFFRRIKMTIYFLRRTRYSRSVISIYRNYKSFQSVSDVAEVHQYFLMKK